MKPLILFILSALWALAQTELPKHQVSAGAAVNYLDSPRSYVWVSWGARIKNSTYSWSSVDMTRTSSSVRTGLAQVLASEGRTTLTGFADAGVGISEGGNWNPAVGTGIAILINLHGPYHAGFGLRLVKVAGDEIKPVFGFGFGRTWR